MLLVLQPGPSLEKSKLEFDSIGISKDVLSQLGSIKSPWSSTETNGSKKFKSKPYHLAAIELQKLSEEKREATLKELAKPRSGYQEQVFVLCRMLYVAKDGGSMRRAGLGLPTVIGSVDYRKLKNDPIKIVDGIPFLVVNGYLLGGRPETAEKYLSYCISNCKWTDFRYAMGMAGEYERAAQKLIDEWPTELDDFAKKLILSQVE